MGYKRLSKRICNHTLKTAFKQRARPGVDNTPPALAWFRSGRALASFLVSQNSEISMKIHAPNVELEAEAMPWQEARAIGAQMITSTSGRNDRCCTKAWSNPLSYLKCPPFYSKSSLKGTVQTPVLLEAHTKNTASQQRHPLPLMCTGWTLRTLPLLVSIVNTHLILQKGLPGGLTVSLVSPCTWFMLNK